MANRLSSAVNSSPFSNTVNSNTFGNTIPNSATSYGIAQAAARLLGTGAGDPDLVQKIKDSGLTAAEIGEELSRMHYYAANNVPGTFQAILDGRVRNWQAGVQLP